MNRHTLPNRRRCETIEFHHAGLCFTLSVGFYPHDRRVGEIFISSDKPGSPIEALARDAAILVSISLQHGAELATIRHALTRDHDGGPATLIGAALDLLVEETPR